MTLRKQRQAPMVTAWRAYTAGNPIVARNLGDGRTEIRHPMGGTTTWDTLDFEALLHPDDVQVCSRCGCHDRDACEGGCEWVRDDLCSACAPGMVPA